MMLPQQQSLTSDLNAAIGKRMSYKGVQITSKETCLE